MTDSLTHSLTLTKLQRPRVGRELVHRLRLLEQLAAPAALTLVVAPAGYGKTTLLTDWLATCAWPSAWLSLGAQDDDLITFTTYLIAAVQTLFPEVGAETLDLLHGVTRPPLEAVTRSLLNACESIEQEFILVLDDYHVIHDDAVHELITELARYSPRNLYLVVAARFDPPLPLSSFRARGHFTELRAANLRFTVDEAACLLRDRMRLPVDDQSVAILRTRTDGWAVGLRLAALYYRHTGRFNVRGVDQDSSSRYVMDYLLAEVFSQLPAAIQDFLLKTSILDRLCGPLCEAIRGVVDPENSGRVSLEWLHQADLFLTLLGDERDWYRYHPLFQEFLRQQLTQQYTPAEVSALHLKASAWLADNGYTEEALQHALAADDIAAAVQIVAQQRRELMNHEQWLRLERWLQLFPRDVIDREPELLLSEAWYLQNRQQHAYMPPLLDRVETLLRQLPLDAAVIDRMQGEVETWRSSLYFFVGDSAQSRLAAQRALERLPAEWWMLRAQARLFLSASYVLTGELGPAYANLDNSGEPDHGVAFRKRLLVSACFVHGMAADLSGLTQAATQILDGSDPLHLQMETNTWAHYHLGLAYYQRNDLAAAERQLTPLVLQPSQSHVQCFLNSAAVLALIYQAQDQPDKAREIAETLVPFALQIRDTIALSTAKAFQAELALRQGRLAEAGHWAEQYHIPLAPMPFFCCPPIILARIRLAQNTSLSRQQARQVLCELADYFRSTSCTAIMIEVLALQALLHQAEGDEAQALSALANSIALAEPGGFIRFFVDLGEPLERLLTALVRQQAASPYAAQILAAFPRTYSAATAHRLANEALPAPLTPRELDALDLLDKRYTNKEIAEALVISVETVHSYVTRIGDKLGAHGRQAIVRAARDQGLL
jgi:LuxR family transcriptional regulator, maltose regulon positive regulatory protein